MFLFVLFGIWSNRTSSPEYLVEQKMNRAKRSLTEQYEIASNLYSNLIINRTTKAKEAFTSLVKKHLDKLY